MKYVQIITTTDKKRAAESMARELVKKRLAACIQMWPISSTFSWKGKVATGNEWMLLIKARSSAYQEIETEIARMHSYQIPEIISIPIIKGSKRYTDWMDKATSGKRRHHGKMV